MTRNDTEFAVWIGCLACYNEGRLIGDWHPAADAGEVTTQALHAASGITTDEAGYVRGSEIYGPHEELWVMDTDNAPAGYNREMSPSEAQKVAEALERVDEYQRDAFAAWAKNLSLDLADADVSDFEDAYRGEWDSEKDYAYNLADDMGFEADSTWPAAYIDWDAATRDLFIDGYTAIRTPTGTVWVFNDR